MAIYSIDIEKSSGGEYWTNRYLVTASDLAAASSIAEDIAALERVVHHPSVTFTKARTSDIVAGTDVFVTQPLGVVGQWGVGSQQFLPPVVCVRVDFQLPVGRPLRKFLHCLVPEDAQVNGFLTDDALGYIETSYAFPLATMGVLCDPDGNVATNGVVFRYLTVHQFRRGSRRRTQPILP